MNTLINLALVTISLGGLTLPFLVDASNHKDHYPTAHPMVKAVEDFITQDEN